MGKKLVIAAALVAFMVAPAFAAVQNVKVGGNIKTTSVIRDSFDLGADPFTKTNQNVILTQTHLDIQADLTDNVSTTLGLLNERLWGNTTSADQSSGAIELETAYVTMKEFLYSPLTLQVGRQPLVYGNQFLVGFNPVSNSVPAVNDLSDKGNFDAVKASLSYDPLTVDLFAAKISESGSVAQNDDDDANLYGINANYKLGDDMNTVVEAYTFAKIDKGAVGSTSASETQKDKIFVPGLRVSTNPVEGLNVQLEGAYEFGEVGQGATADQKTTLRAYGLQGMVNYALPVLQDLKPVVSGSYTYLSADNKDSNDGKNRAFNTLYENQNTGRIFDDLLPGQSGMNVVSLAGEMTPIQDLTTKLTWYGVWLNRKNAPVTLYQADGSGPYSPAMTSKKSLGNELDLDLTYAYTEDVKFGVSAGYFMPGTAFAAGNKDSASQLLTSVNVAF